MKLGLSTISLREPSSVLDSAISIEARSNDQHYPAAAKLAISGTELSIPRFAPYEEGADGSWSPAVQAAVVDDVAVVLGLACVVVIDLSRGRVSSLTSLFRNDHADRGWFVADCFGLDAVGFLLVYEGGAMLVSREGRIRWHLPKAWDDVLVGEPGDELHFLSGDGGRFSVSVSDGVRIQADEGRY